MPRQIDEEWIARHYEALSPQWSNKWPLRQFLEAYYGVIIGARSFESFWEACMHYGVDMSVVWGEARSREAFIVQTEPNFYKMLEAYEMFGYYPAGHHKQRRGTWMGVLRFGMRLGIALAVGGGKRAIR